MYIYTYTYIHIHICVCICICIYVYVYICIKSLWPHGLQHEDMRPPCPSPSPRVHPSSCPLNWWCHPTISSSTSFLSLGLQSFPASESFPISQLVTSGGQSIGASASASVLPMDIQDWYPLGWTGLILLKISAYTGTWCVIVVASQISEEFFSKTDSLYWEKWVASYLMPFTTINSR